MQVDLQLSHLKAVLQKDLLQDLAETTGVVKNQSLRKLVYTSMDGDDMKYVDFIRVFVYQQGYIPVNPIATLGYYTSTIGHQGSKREIIKDCYSLMLACDELWVFGKKRPGFSHLKLREETVAPGNLSEGILGEMLVWLEHRPSSAVRLFTWKDVGVPKYAKAEQWALTNKELVENVV